MSTEQFDNEQHHQPLAAISSSRRGLRDSSPDPSHTKSVRIKFEASRRSAVQNLRDYLHTKDSESDDSLNSVPCLHSNNITATHLRQQGHVARDLLRADLIMMMHYLEDIARMERSGASIWSFILCVFSFGFGQDMAQTAMYDIVKRLEGLATQLRALFVQRWQSQVQGNDPLPLEATQSSTTFEAATSLDKVHTMMQDVINQAQRSIPQPQGIGDSSAHVPTNQQAAAKHSILDEEWVFVDPARSVQSEIERLNASYNRWWFLRGALLVGLGTTFAFASYQGSRYATIIWCQRTIKTLQRRLDHGKIDECNRHDLEGLGFNYLWWINMMLSKH